MLEFYIHEGEHAYEKLFMKFCVVVLSCFMVFNTAYLPSYAEDEMSYYEQNDLANSFRYSNGEAKDVGDANYAARATTNSGWPNDPKAICKGIDVSYHNGTIDWKRVKQSSRICDYQMWLWYK